MIPIRVKECFEPIVLQDKADGFLLFVKAFSWATDLWVTVGAFTVKKRKLMKGNFYLTKNELDRNEILCAEDNHSYMCYISVKEFLDSHIY